MNSSHSGRTGLLKEVTPNSLFSLTRTNRRYRTNGLPAQVTKFVLCVKSADERPGHSHFFLAFANLRVSWSDEGIGDV